MVAIFINASDGAPIELDLKGNFWGGSAEIVLSGTGRTVATISRQVANMREIFADKQTCSYSLTPLMVEVSCACAGRVDGCADVCWVLCVHTDFVTVAPGVDLALIAAVCICFDEAANESN